MGSGAALFLIPFWAIASSAIAFFVSDAMYRFRRISPNFRRALSRCKSELLIWCIIVYLTALGPSLIVGTFAFWPAVGTAVMIGLICGLAPSEEVRRGTEQQAADIDAIVAALNSNGSPPPPQANGTPARAKWIAGPVGYVLPIPSGVLLSRLASVRKGILRSFRRQEREEIAAVARAEENRGPIIALYEEELEDIVDHFYELSQGSLEGAQWLRLCCLGDNRSPAGYMKVHALMRIHGSRKVTREINHIRLGRRRPKLQWGPDDSTARKAWLDRDWFRRKASNPDTDTCRVEINKDLLMDPVGKYLDYINSKRTADRCAASRIERTVHMKEGFADME